MKTLHDDPTRTDLEGTQHLQRFDRRHDYQSIDGIVGKVSIDDDLDIIRAEAKPLHARPPGHHPQRSSMIS
jgi:hypothetical protein